VIDEPDNSAADLDDAPVAEEAHFASEADRSSASAESVDVGPSEAEREQEAAESEEEEVEAAEPKRSAPETPAPEPEPEGRPLGEKRWYILKVQSNREDSIRDALQRRIAVAGLQDAFDEIIVPIEMVSEFKNGKKRVVKRKLYPGYIVVHMELNEDTWFLVRETPGIGDFTGSGGKPTPMLPHEVSKIVAKQEDKSDEAPKLKIDFNAGDRVKIKEGTFENFEGDVDTIDEANGRVTVMINIFGRSTPVELEYWQIESL
jgi:transcriptional antiterminator NusG